jgi:hypothetical protein
MSVNGTPLSGSIPSSVVLSPASSSPISPARPSLFPAGDVLVVSPPQTPPPPRDPNCWDNFLTSIAEAFKCCWEAVVAFFRGLFCPVNVARSELMQRLEKFEGSLGNDGTVLNLLRYYMNIVRWHEAVTQGGSPEQMRAAFDALTDQKKLFYTNLVAAKLQQRGDERIENAQELRTFTASNTRGITALVMADLERTRENEASLASLTYDYIARVVEEAS